MFKFDLKIPFIEIYTTIMRNEDYQMAYTYICWHFQIWKWHWSLYWGKSKEENELKKGY